MFTHGHALVCAAPQLPPASHSTHGRSLGLIIWARIPGNTWSRARPRLYTPGQWDAFCGDGASVSASHTAHPPSLAAAASRRACRSASRNAAIATTASGQPLPISICAQIAHWRSTQISTRVRCALACVHSTRCASARCGCAMLAATLCGRHPSAQYCGAPTQQKAVVASSHATHSLASRQCSVHDDWSGGGSPSSCHLCTARTLP